jgi:nitroimidazol reductase NimA-like FMN-containing flavoprotein (pyridoxamine 5'-phosphate oxidase superfamily)
MTRPLTDEETASLLASDTVARLATIDASGYPHVTPLWFLWADGAFHLASDAGRPHLARLRANPRAGLVIDVETAQRPDGQRPNRQVRAVGDATLAPDSGAAWTRRIWDKYVTGPTARNALDERVGDRQRVLITITPVLITAVASV